MTLISCAECGTSVSDTAKACPSCGTPRKRMRKGQKRPAPAWLKAVIVLFIVSTVIGAVMQQNKPAPTPEQIAAEAASTKRNTAALRDAQALKNNLRDPSSLQLEYVGVSEDGATTCIRYRGRNGFGGVNVEQMVFVDGAPQTVQGVWRKRCANVDLYDVTGIQSLVR